jgi:hypothetical protein
VVPGDSYFVTIAGTSLGVGVLFGDSLTSLAQRMVDAVNEIFVGVCGAPTVTAGQFTITVLSPINGFSLSTTAGSNLTVGVSGDIGVVSGSVTVGGQEGVWQVDSAQTSPLNKAFVDYLTDFATLIAAASQTMTVAFSQELLAPPDVNTSGGAWTQRYASGVPVLTATGFGSWGAGFVEAASGSPVSIQQTGHGYITGNRVHIAGAVSSGVWIITVTDANNYQLTTLVSGGYTPSVGDSLFIDLQTSQCAFNGSTVTTYLGNCYKQAAGILNGASLTPWLQFGEILHWFFSQTMSLAISNAMNLPPIEITTAAAHGFSTGDTVIVAGVKGLTGANGTWTITVIDTTRFRLNGVVQNAIYAGGGTVSGGGMAFYDPNQAAAAVTALGRALATFHTQDDDPSVNAYADANFLAGRIYTHISTIVTTVLGTYAGAKFELLWPYDVNFSPCYSSSDLPYPIGGRLVRYVNLPSQFNTKAGSSLDRLKMEALAWGTSYRHLDNALATIAFPYTVLTWAKADTRYLIPWQNGGCAWPAEFRACLSQATPVVNFWAFDHICLFSWSQAMPALLRRSRAF